MGAIKTKRASLQPLSMRVGGWVRVISDNAAAATAAANAATAAIAANNNVNSSGAHSLYSHHDV